MKLKLFLFIVSGSLSSTLPAIALQGAPMKAPNVKGLEKELQSLKDKSSQVDRELKKSLEVVIDGGDKELDLQKVKDDVEAAAAKATRYTEKVAAQQQKIAATTNQGPMYVIAGIEFATSKDDSENLFDDNTSYVEIFYNIERLLGTDGFFGTNLSMGVSVDFRQAYSATTNNLADIDADTIKKAEAFGLTFSPKLAFNDSGMFLRGDIGGVIFQTDDELKDEKFNSEVAVVFGFERDWENNQRIRIEAGPAYYDRLPDEKFRSVVRAVYGYKVSPALLALLSAEISGAGQGNEEARVQLGVMMDPAPFFEGMVKTITGKN